MMQPCLLAWWLVGGPTPKNIADPVLTLVNHSKLLQHRGLTDDNVEGLLVLLGPSISASLVMILRRTDDPYEWMLAFMISNHIGNAISGYRNHPRIYSTIASAASILRYLVERPIEFIVVTNAFSRMLFGFPPRLDPVDTHPSSLVGSRVFQWLNLLCYWYARSSVNLYTAYILFPLLLNSTRWLVREGCDEKTCNVCQAWERGYKFV